MSWVMPVAEIVGGVLRWHIPAPDYALAQHYLRGVHLLYDQAAIDAAVAAERERCCRVVAVQRDDDRYDVARRTILAICAGDDFHAVDDDVLRA